MRQKLIQFIDYNLPQLINALSIDFRGRSFIIRERGPVIFFVTTNLMIWPPRQTAVVNMTPHRRMFVWKWPPKDTSFSLIRIWRNTRKMTMQTCNVKHDSWFYLCKSAVLILIFITVLSLDDGDWFAWSQSRTMYELWLWELWGEGRTVRMRILRLLSNGFTRTSICCTNLLPNTPQS